MSVKKRKVLGIYLTKPHVYLTILNALLDTCIKSSANTLKKEIPSPKEKFALFNALAHTSCICIIIANTLQDAVLYA